VVVGYTFFVDTFFKDLEF